MVKNPSGRLVPLPGLHGLAVPLDLLVQVQGTLHHCMIASAWGFSSVTPSVPVQGVGGPVTVYYQYDLTSSNLLK